MLKYFVGIEIMKVSQGLCMSQRKYFIELLHSFGMLGCKPLSTPLKFGILRNSQCVDASDELLLDVTEFQKVMIKLSYLTIMRLGISLLVHVLSQLSINHITLNLKLVIRVFKILKKKLLGKVFLFLEVLVLMLCHL